LYPCWAVLYFDDPTVPVLRYKLEPVPVKDQIRFYHSLEPPVKGHNRFFDFENHRVQGIYYIYPTLTSLFQVPKMINHPMLEQTVKKKFIYSTTINEMVLLFFLFNDFELRFF